MANYLGPESPRPFSVISETYRNRLKIPVYSTEDQHSFGETWEENMFQLIHKHLELGTADRFCYIGEEKGSLVEKLEHKFCLLEPTYSVIPGCNAHVDTICKTKRVSIPIAGVGAEEHFEKMARDAPYKGPSFDRVLLMDCIQYFENPAELYGNIMRTVSDFGKILIIHRPGSMNSLPYPRDALIRVQEKDHPYMQMIRDLQNHNFDVQWEIETLPIIMPKVKWLAMLRDRYPSQLEAISNFEVSAGMRELCEGALKYEGEMIEFIDRLLFITATRNLSQGGMPMVKRWGNVGKPQPTPTGQALNLRLEVTPDIARFVKNKDWKPKEDKRYPYTGN